MTGEAILTVANLAIGRGGRLLASGLSFEAREGDIVALMGPNGSGKTILLLTLLGEHRPSGGSFTIGGDPERRGMALVPQADAIDPIFPFSVDEILRAASFGARRRTAREREEALAKVGLGGFRHRLFSRLSGGERQRALLARALLKDCPLLLLDEPTSAIDPDSQTTMMRAVMHRVAQSRCAALVVSHRLEELHGLLTVLVRLGEANPGVERVREPWLPEEAVA